MMLGCVGRGGNAQVGCTMTKANKSNIWVCICRICRLRSTSRRLNFNIYLRISVGVGALSVCIMCSCHAVHTQAVRDEILNIMHRNNIPEKNGTWMEQWHQKLVRHTASAAIRM